MNDETSDRRVTRQKRSWRGWIAAGVLLAAGVAWIFRPYSHADESLIDPRLRALKKPFQSVELTVIFDGGSSGISITDASGKTEDFLIPCDEPHPKVYLQASRTTREGEVPATNHEATQQEIVAIAAEHWRDIWGCHVLEHISGRLRDKLRTRFWRMWSDELDRLN